MPIGVNTNWLNLLPQVAKLALPIFTVSKIKKGITNTALHLVLASAYRDFFPYELSRGGGSEIPIVVGAIPDRGDITLDCFWVYGQGSACSASAKFVELLDVTLDHHVLGLSRT